MFIYTAQLKRHIFIVW